jgi:hypothetical protein
MGSFLRDEGPEPSLTLLIDRGQASGGRLSFQLSCLLIMALNRYTLDSDVRNRFAVQRIDSSSKFANTRSRKSIE